MTCPSFIGFKDFIAATLNSILSATHIPLKIAITLHLTFKFSSVVHLIVD
jgi:hypothetical protein